ncbi:hypothetical protein LXL04_025430 [Taraxacum kok-saghyz]
MLILHLRHHDSRRRNHHQHPHPAPRTPPQRSTARSRIQCFPIAPIQRIQLHLHPPPHLTGPFPRISGVHHLRHSRLRHVKPLNSSFHDDSTHQLPHFHFQTHHQRPGPVVIHGVSGPFASFKFHQQITQLPICAANRSDVSRGIAGAKIDLTKNKVEWATLVKFLNTTGFAPFATGLHTVLDGVFKEHPNLRSLTIFAPPIIEAMEIPQSVLQKFVKSHIVPKKHSFKHLASMPQGATIKTLCPGTEIKITETVKNPSEELLSINRVEITSPDLFASKSFVVHGIARAFSLYEIRGKDKIRENTTKYGSEQENFQNTINVYEIRCTILESDYDSSKPENVFQNLCFQINKT